MVTDRFVIYQDEFAKKAYEPNNSNAGVLRRLEKLSASVVTTNATKDQIHFKLASKKDSKFFVVK